MVILKEIDAQWKISDEKRLYFCLCYGAADIISDADESHVERFETKQHDYPVYLLHDPSMLL